MPVMDHIRELRNRVVKAILAIALGMVVGFIIFHWAWAKIEQPFCSAMIDGMSGLYQNFTTPHPFDVIIKLTTE